MTDQPNSEHGERLPVPRPSAPPPAPAERFAAPPSAHRFGLSSERAAQIVRQSGSARSVGFLSVLIIVVFLTGYYFYDTGVPGVSGRQAQAAQELTVTEVANGYTLFEANCARCHGASGQGYIGPALNDQVKLSTHLSAQYIQNVLTVGGRYVCGDPNSIMPVWADTNGGPLNYQQIADIISFIRAPSTMTFDATDPATGKTVTLHGWRDPSYTLPANATPFPACWSKPNAGSAAPSGSGASAQPSGSGAGASGAPGASGQTGSTINLTAQSIAFQQTSLSAPANKPFTIVFNNQDSVLHNVVIKSPSGQQVFSGDLVQGPATKSYQVGALAAGTYSFFCAVHPNMTGTITVK